MVLTSTTTISSIDKTVKCFRQIKGYCLLSDSYLFDVGEPQRINAHEDAISYCDFINDNTLVTSSYDNTLALWVSPLILRCGGNN